MKANLGNRSAADHQTNGVPQRHVELPALVPITWSVAGGMLLGGGAVGILVLTSRMSGHTLIASSAVFFAVGALLGLLHGALLGILGRPEGWTPRQALASMMHGLVFLVPMLLLGWLGAGWAAALPLALRGRNVVAIGITAVAWILMAMAVAVAAEAGFKAARFAYRRWPDRLPGTVLVGATFVSLSVMFAIQRPTVWFFNVPLTTTGSVAFVFALTFWFYGPIITAALALLRRVAPLFPASHFRTGGRVYNIATKAAIAVAAGLVVASLAVPFHAGVLGLPSDAERYGLWSAIALAMGNAVTTELLLRLFLFTAAFVLAARYMPRSQWAVGVAVAVASVGDLLLQWPDLMALGLPGLPIILSYLVARVAIPALLFGYLFWRRGLGTTLTAHATAGMIVGLLAL